MERRVWQRTKQAAQATARFVKYLPLAASLMLYACDSCQTNKNGVKNVGNGNTEFLKKEDDPKKRIVLPDSLKSKADTLAVKSDSERPIIRIPKENPKADEKLSQETVKRLSKKLNSTQTADSTNTNQQDLLKGMKPLPLTKPSSKAENKKRMERSSEAVRDKTLVR